LGSLMYGGGLVKPVAELIANAWDADATRVDVTLPTTSARTFEVVDDGHGMTWDDCKTRYLVVGDDRRTKRGSNTSSGKRNVMGRKGIGKLAVISAAATVEVDTVAKVDDGTYWRTTFRIPYGDLLSGKKRDPKSCITMLADGPAPRTLKFAGGSRTGTRTRLLDLVIDKNPNVDPFV